MGFEQLAALKEQLAKQAKEAKKAEAPNEPKAPKQAKPASPAKKASRARPGAAAGTEKAVDPVVLAISRLQKRFPQAFPKNPAPKLPLKVGIFDDLLQHAKDLALSESELRDAIRTWCQGSRYWTCMVEGAQRVNLAGEGVGQVTQADAKRAQQLKTRRVPRARRKAANVPAESGGTATKSEG